MKANNVLYLITGIGVGFLAGVYFSKEKYKKIADEEIKSVIEEFRDMKSDSKTKSQDEAPIIPDKAEAIRKNYSKMFESKTPKKEKEAPIIEVIDEDEFGEGEDEGGIPYVTETLFYYKDGVLANSDNDIASEKMIGTTHISPKDWNNDAIYFRNHTLKMDIEVLKEERDFEEVKEKEQYYEEE